MLIKIVDHLNYETLWTIQQVMEHIKANAFKFRRIVYYDNSQNSKPLQCVFKFYLIQAS